jgi:hypothetical protein
MAVALAEGSADPQIVAKAIDQKMYRKFRNFSSGIYFYFVLSIL